MPFSKTLRASMPWPVTERAVIEADREPLAVQQAAYRCERGCEFTVPFAADAEPPTGFDCRCGGEARLEGAPEDAETRAPGYVAGTGAQSKGTAGKGEGMDPWGQLMKRRTRKELDAILAERLAQRQGGEAQ